MPDEPPDSIRLLLQVADSAPAGAPVTMTIRVDNVSGRRLNLHLLGRSIAFDLIVLREDGGAVWRRMEGEIVPMTLRLESLESGASLDLRDSWPVTFNDGRPAPPGEYTVRGELFTEGTSLLTAPARLVIEPPDHRADARGPAGTG